MILLYKNENNIPKSTNKRRVTFDGEIITTIDSAYLLLKTELNFPDYFGNNLDALADTLTDLEFIDDQEIEIIILNYNKFLRDESSEDKDSFIETIAYAVDEMDYKSEENDEGKKIFLYINYEENLKDFLEESDYFTEII